MTIHFACSCGKVLHAPDAAAGKRARCPACGGVCVVPATESPAAETPPAEIPADEFELKPVERPASLPAGAAKQVIAASTPSADYVRRSGTPSLSSPIAIALANEPMLPLWRRYLYFALLLALIPLAVLSFNSGDDSTNNERIKQTVANHPEEPDLGDRVNLVIRQINDSPAISRSQSLDRILAALPGHRFEGAVLARESKAHWLVALVSAGFFFALMLFLFPSPGTKPVSLLIAGAFTGTIGVMLLLGFQWAAANAVDVPFRGGGYVALIFLIVKLIGLSYYLAENPEYGFFISFIGFTFGVGLCEETTKIIPLLIRVTPAPLKSDPSWQGLVLWGLASGVGFGVAEGIMYSGDTYNGVSGAGIYGVRFISCVVLHAMWTASAGITLYNHQGWLTDADSKWGYCGRVVMIIAISMTLHGLYDVLLKQQHDVLALLAAAATFGWLAYQIETMRKKEPMPALA